MKSKNKRVDSSNKIFISTMMRILRYMKKDYLNLLIVVIFSIASTIFLIVGPKIMGKATTEIFNGVIRKIGNAQEGIDFSYILKLVLILLLLYTISSIFSFIQSYIMTGIAQRVSYNLRKDIAEKLNNLPISCFDKNSKGDIISRVTNDVDTLGQTLNQNLMSMVVSVVRVVGVFIMMLSINFTMTLSAIVILPITVVLLSIIIKKSQHYFRMQQDYLGKVNGKVEESFSGQNVIKAYNGEKFEELEFKSINNELYQSGWKSQFLSSVMMPIMMFVGNLGYVIVTILGGYMAILGKITVGDIQAFIQYMRSFTQPLNQIAQMIALFQSTVAAAGRVFEFLDEPEIDNTQNGLISDEDFKGHIEFKNVKFGYEKDKIIINDFNLDVKPGQKIAIVGPTGAGKTTLVKLLMRFYDTTDGTIYLDGRDIQTLEVTEYRKRFAMVLQDTWLFSGTIMENLRYGKLDATDEEVYQAARMASADRFILTQKDGYETILTEDTKNISQGQKQLLTIARAILSNPKILILDEATSSVDTRTEELIQNAMDRLIENRTSFIIAHRLSTIRNADLILVLEDGDIVEQGSHDELIKKDGAYKKLYNSQYEDVVE
ncbi:ABC transporter ATP-binding protein [Peptostreptococcus faecalis]|uniref:ABC transporter ATP-binding protein n=1 Tax=Peptostreptococcus faecalis TaxID=2045015 RepID=UPI000C79A16E|nr:ABC transporter ATP-binding protein [Peptostreptococcus faecalis]